MLGKCWEWQAFQQFLLIFHWLICTVFELFWYVFDETLMLQQQVTINIRWQRLFQRIFSNTGLIRARHLLHFINILPEIHYLLNRWHSNFKATLISTNTIIICCMSEVRNVPVAVQQSPNDMLAFFAKTSFARATIEIIAPSSEIFPSIWWGFSLISDAVYKMLSNSLNHWHFHLCFCHILKYVQPLQFAHLL